MASHNYNCSQQNLYTIARLAWHSCNKYLSAFNEFSPYYTTAYIAAAITEIDAAQLISNREETTQTLHAQLIGQANQCLRCWQQLKKYIKKAYPEDQQLIKYNAAGYQHYRKASRKYWSHCTQLLNDANSFISNHLTQLLANNNMPPAFPATFNTATTEYTSLLNRYYSSSQLSQVDTEEKILANNAIQEQLMKMLLDGQNIFKRNPAVKKLFTFDQLLITLTANRAAQ